MGFVADGNKIKTDNLEEYKFIENHSWIKDGVIVEFEVDDEGFAHKLSAFGATRKYKVPSSFMLSANEQIRGWQNISKSGFVLQTPLCASELMANNSLKKHAVSMGANAILNHKISKVGWLYRASGVPAQVGRQSEQLDSDLVDERDFADINALSKFIKRYLDIKTFLFFACSLLSIFFGFLPLLTLYVLNASLVASSSAWVYVWVLAGFVWAFVFKPYGARLIRVRDE